MSPPSVSSSLLEYLPDLPDPRIERCKQHQLLDIITIGILAAICDAEHFTEMEEFNLSKEAWLRTFLKLGHCIPSHDTFARDTASPNRLPFKNASCSGCKP